MGGLAVGGRAGRLGRRGRLPRPGLLALIAVVGCGHATVIQSHEQGGVIALRGLPDQARKDARRTMRDHCDGPFYVVKEEMVPAGTKPGSRLVADQMEGTHVIETEEEKTEVHITFRCGPNPALSPVQQQSDR